MLGCVEVKLVSRVRVQAGHLALQQIDILHTDMSELVKNVKGPSEWYCKNGQDCWYNGEALD